MPAFNVIVCVPSWFHTLKGKCSSNHVDLKYWMNSSALLVRSASGLTRVQAMLMNLGGIKGSAAASVLKFLVATSFSTGPISEPV